MYMLNICSWSAVRFEYKEFQKTKMQPGNIFNGTVCDNVAGSNVRIGSVDYSVYFCQIIGWTDLSMNFVLVHAILV